MPVKKTDEDQGAKLLSKNMRFYQRVMDTPKEAQKSFNNGRFSGTDINPMWRIKKLSELFGPAGQGWWTRNEKFELVPFEKTGEIAVFCTLELVYVDPETELMSQPITGVGGNMFVTQRKSGLQINDEAYKMAYTDALSIACKSLGFSHDIYFANDRTKYSMMSDDQPKAETSNAEPDAQAAAIQDRIQKGIQMLTKNMNSDQKKEFAQANIVPIIGDENYRKCTDVAKLQALLNNLLAKASA